MSVAVVITTLVLLGLGAKTPESAKGRLIQSPVAATADGQRQGSTPPQAGDPAQLAEEVDYWHAKAQKRLRLLSKRERRIVVLLKRLRVRQPSEPRTSAGSGASGARSIICSVFGSYCSQALRVAECESGFNVYARNGQYWGLFQFGSYARARYGFDWNAWTQSRAAYRYFRDAGWGPWTCKP